MSRRIAVVGNSGSGKSTMAQTIAETLGCDHIELDAIHHLPDWTPIDRDEMRSIVADRIAANSWVVDGNYNSMVQDLVLARADEVVWLDLPRHTVMPRVIKRTLGRMVMRRELWNGNRERLRNLFRVEPEENIVLWSWTQHFKYRARYESAMTRYPGLTWTRITNSTQQRRWLKDFQKEQSPRRSEGPD